MEKLLWLIPALPFAGMIVLTLAGRGLSKKGIASIGTGSVGLSAILVILTGAQFLHTAPSDGAYTQRLWTWISAGGFEAAVSLRLDALSLVMAFVITFVGLLIHVYSIEYMEGDEGYARFFTYMNLFVGSMLTLALADNLLLLYLGWEGVGLCSYLLIGFWYKEPYNGYAARKAFIVTRMGDTALLLGLLLLFVNLGTLDIQEILTRAGGLWLPDSGLAMLACALVLGGAIGKSAQVPLQVWLPDAMAGPTPVSALIHAATMVTAGVYLIARTHTLFELAPSMMTVVAAVGAITLLVSAFSALCQADIKRVLAYSTISQIGYMFLALGVGAWGAAIFHFMTHAFFKALLFLCAGSVIKATNGEHDIFKMGGLRKDIPFTFWTFLIGAASLSALPLVTAGYYSKELILDSAWASGAGGGLLWTAGLAGAFLTALYAFRLIFITFFGEKKKAVAARPGAPMNLPIAILAVLSITAGFLNLPGWLGEVRLFSSFIEKALPAKAAALSGGEEFFIGAAAMLAPVAGAFAAYILYSSRPKLSEDIAGSKAGGVLRGLWASGWGFDRVYDIILVRPFLRASSAAKSDVLDLPYSGLAWIARAANIVFVLTQNGRVRWYAAGMTVGAVLALSAIFIV